MELSIIEKQYSDIEFKVSHMDEDFDFSKISYKSPGNKMRNSTSSKTKKASNPKSQPVNHYENPNSAYQYPRQDRYRHLDFSRLQQ